MLNLLRQTRFCRRWVHSVHGFHANLHSMIVHGHTAESLVSLALWLCANAMATRAVTPTNTISISLVKQLRVTRGAGRNQAPTPSSMEKSELGPQQGEKVEPGSNPPYSFEKSKMVMEITTTTTRTSPRERLKNWSLWLSVLRRSLRNNTLQSRRHIPH